MSSDTAPLMVSISGVRGIANRSITPEMVVRYVAAFAHLQITRHRDTVAAGRKAEIILIRDSRISGPWIEQISAGVLQAMGVNVISCGIQPTPTAQLLALQRDDAIGALVITSSHNPKEWNGLKFIDADGLFLSPEHCEQLFASVEGNHYEYPHFEERGSLITYEEAAQVHIDTCLALPYVDVEATKKRHFKVVLDSVNGAGGPIMEKLLQALGCQVIGLNLEPHGDFAHTPEPVPENLGQLCEAVKEHQADFGVAVDPDVDRFVLIDETGQPLGEEYTLALAVQFYLSATKKVGPICKNLSSSRVCDDIAKQFGCTSVSTPVGEIHVARKMVELDAIIGGEGNGGVMLPDVHIGRDALVAAVLTIPLLASFEGTISELKQTMPQYEIVKLKAPVGDMVPEVILADIKKQWEGKPGVTLTEGDGLRIDTEEFWVHMRKSNTEPIIRVIGEHQTKEQAMETCERFMEDIKNWRPAE